MRGAARAAKEKRSDAVAKALIANIESGRYPVGSFLPPEQQLRETFGVSRFAVREAMDLMVSMGLVARRRRIGTVVLSSKPYQRFDLSLQRTEELSSYLKSTKLHVVSKSLVGGDYPTVANVIQSTADWWKIDTYRTLLTTMEFSSWTEILIPTDYERAVELIGSRPGSSVQFITSEYGEAPVLVRQKLSATIIPAHVAETVGVSPTTAALKFLRCFYKADYKLIEIALSYYPEGSFEYVMDLEPRKPI